MSSKRAAGETGAANVLPEELQRRRGRVPARLRLRAGFAGWWTPYNVAPEMLNGVQWGGSSMGGEGGTAQGGGEGGGDGGGGDGGGL